MSALVATEAPRLRVLRKAHRNGYGTRWFSLADGVSLYGFRLFDSAVAWRVASAGGRVNVRVSKTEAKRLIRAHVLKGGA